MTLLQLFRKGGGGERGDKVEYYTVRSAKENLEGEGEREGGVPVSCVLHTIIGGNILANMFRLTQNV